MIIDRRKILVSTLVPADVGARDRLLLFLSQQVGKILIHDLVRAVPSDPHLLFRGFMAGTIVKAASSSSVGGRSTPLIDHAVQRIAQDGFVILPAVFPAADVEFLLIALNHALQAPSEATAIRSQGGIVFAARNVLTLWPDAEKVSRQPPLPEVLTAIMGPDHGLVRVLFFDKPPDRTWSLPWHKDLTIAVRDNRIPSPHFSKPTCKAGVPHVEAPLEVLERMVTMRLHLDEVTEENGPLQVAVGSHRTGKEMRLDDRPPRVILAGAGDVLLMRPLLAHCSGSSHPETRRHRRILHLEFAASRVLTDGYEWYDFRAGHQSRQEHAADEPLKDRN